MDEAETPGKSVSKKARKHFCLIANQAREITGMLERRLPVCGFFKASSTAEMKRMSIGEDGCSFLGPDRQNWGKTLRP